MPATGCGSRDGLGWGWGAVVVVVEPVRDPGVEPGEPAVVGVVGLEGVPDADLLVPGLVCVTGGVGDPGVD
jgi:hypothetical protein